MNGNARRRHLELLGKALVYISMVLDMPSLDVLQLLPLLQLLSVTGVGTSEVSLRATCQISTRLAQ
jgi:hypothetical protein